MSFYKRRLVTMWTKNIRWEDTFASRGFSLISLQKKKKKTPNCYVSLCFKIWKTNPDDYDEESAVAHVRRVLDIVACTASFGSSVTAKGQLKPDASKNAAVAQEKGCAAAKKTVSGANKESASKSSTKDVPVDAGEMSHSCSNLGTFYDFFSLSHLAPPLQCTVSLHNCFCLSLFAFFSCFPCVRFELSLPTILFLFQL